MVIEEYMYKQTLSMAYVAISISYKSVGSYLKSAGRSPGTRMVRDPENLDVVNDFIKR